MGSLPRERVHLAILVDHLISTSAPKVITIRVHMDPQMFLFVLEFEYIIYIYDFIATKS